MIYNTLPGTTSAAGVKAGFLKDIISGVVSVPDITADFAFELLSHMKGGPSINVLLDLALGKDKSIALSAAEVLKTQVFLYEADTSRLKAAHEAGNDIATDILKSYAEAEFFTKLLISMSRLMWSPILPQRVIFQLTCSHLAIKRIHDQTGNCMVSA
ncbi:MAG: hypothetical protein CM15mP119_3530 [Alphaproteobacteria bacterium]|nr:MAG: hypothetical protein CM15mP119_3530 [Alphaproteobacteria bacterium]